MLEETPSRVYLVLPHAVAGENAELSDADLATVAAGGVWTSPTEHCASCLFTSPACCRPD